MPWRRSNNGPALLIRPRHPRGDGRLWALVPLTLVLLLTFGFPIVETVRLSFTDTSLLDPASARYTLGSYQWAFDSGALRNSLGVTLVFAVASLVLQMALGLGIAVLIDEAARAGLRGTVASRTAVVMAWAVPGVVIGVIWGLLYQPTPSGVINYLLRQVGGSGNVAFLSSPSNALPSVIVANVWRGTALTMILCYAGLKTIPSELLEAGRVDGASWPRLFASITLPLMGPILLVALIIATANEVNTFDMLLALTGGGPGASTQVLALGAYQLIFGSLRLGRGAVIVVCLLAINCAVTAVYLRWALPRMGGR